MWLRQAPNTELTAPGQDLGSSVALLFRDKVATAFVVCLSVLAPCTLVQKPLQMGRVSSVASGPEPWGRERLRIQV